MLTDSQSIWKSKKGEYLVDKMLKILHKDSWRELSRNYEKSNL
jgi:hypothetical protein